MFMSATDTQWELHCLLTVRTAERQITHIAGQINKQKGSFGITVTRQTEHTTWEQLQFFLCCCSEQTVTGGRQLNVAACGMRVVELAAGSDVPLTCRLLCYCISFQLHMYTHYRVMT